MADKKISALTASATPLAGTEVLPIVQSGSTVKVAVSDLTAGRAVSATQMTLSTGNVIIGTTAKGITTGSAIPLGFGVNNTVSAMTIDTAGNVGIGTASPSTKMELADSATVRVTVLNTTGNVKTQMLSDATSGYLGTDSNHPLSFFTNQVVRATISAAGDITASTGNLVIGTAAKGITTGSAISLGFGVNNSVTAVTISTSSNLLVGTTVDAGALANTQAVTAGKFQTFSGETASLASGATEDITGLVSGAAYLVTCRGSANTGTFVIHTVYVNGAGAITLAVLSSGNGFVLTSPSANTLRVTSLVTTQTYPYTLTRIF